MKLLQNRQKRQSLHALNEREIQERLYGKYHKEIVAEPEKLGNSSNPFRARAIESPKRFTFPAWPASALRSIPSLVLRGAKSFPWKFAGIVVVALTVSVLLLQFLSSWLTRVRTGPTVSEVTAPTETEIRAVRPKPVSQSAKLQSSAVSPAAAPVTVPAAEVPKKKVFAVQVCTYEREEDARQLIRELQSLNFPAFYRRFLSARERIPYFVVFLSEESTYAQAQGRLNEFRKTKQFLTFSDSFIRSL